MPLTKQKTQLPNARLLANAIYGMDSVPDSRLTLVHMQFGQYIAHDISFQSGVIGAASQHCCLPNGTYQYCDVSQELCAPVPILAGDPVYPSTIQCMDFTRSFTDHDVTCGQEPPAPTRKECKKIKKQKRKRGGQARNCLRPYEQINRATAFLDHSPTYGSNINELNKARSYTDGLLKTSSDFDLQFPPLQTGKISCAFPDENCYDFPDIRANSDPGLFAVQTIFYLEHNVIATNLKHQNPNWNDTMLFEMARKINIGILQHIVYDEFLYNVLDQQTLFSKRIAKPNNANSFINDYDATKLPGTFKEFSAAAFRSFHTQIEGHLR